MRLYPLCERDACGVLQCAAVSCSVSCDGLSSDFDLTATVYHAGCLWCVAVCCSKLQCELRGIKQRFRLRQFITQEACSILQYVAG